MAAYPPQKFLTLKEASRVFEVSVTTLHRLRRAGELEAVGAHRDADGTWKIPRTGLAQLGYRLREEAPSDTPGTSTVNDGTGGTSGAVPRVADTHAHPASTPDTAEIQALRERLVEAERRAAVAEAIATERERIISAQETALRMLEAPRPALSAESTPPDRATAAASAPSTDTAPADQTPPASTAAPQPPRRGLWARLTGR